MDIRTISKRSDGSYVIDGLYHVPDNEEFAIEFSECQAWDIAHPGSVTREPDAPIPVQTEEPPIIITSDNITVADADMLLAAASSGEKTAGWLIAKLGL